jgi:OOP family OmpA-OmpF porin
MKTLKKLYAFSILGLAASVPVGAALAADDVTMWPYVSGSMTYTFADSHRHSDDGIGGVLGGGIPLNRYFSVELDGGYSSFGADHKIAGSQPWHEYLGYVEGQYFYSRNPKLAPYIALDLGNAHEHLSGLNQSESVFFAGAGFGALHYFRLFNTDLALRGDFRYRWIDTKGSHFGGVPGDGVSSFGEPVISVGLLIPLGRHSKPLPPLGEYKAEAPPLAPPAEPTGKGPNRRFEDVHFAFDKYNLTDYAKASLDGDATTITKMSGKYPDLNVDVSGHTDWIGTDAYNQALSERRANSVRDYLVRKGVDAAHIRTFAYGESQPVAPNTTAEGRALNRRAEIRTSAAQ